MTTRPALAAPGQAHLAGARPVRAPEADIQAAIVDYVRAVAPDDVCIFAVPNAARRTVGGRAANAVPGLMPGVFDLCLALRGGRVAFVEVKRPRETLSDPQEDFRDVLIRFGTPYCVATSIEDMREFLARLKIETREVLA